jgi:hypothetical protein
MSFIVRCRTPTLRMLSSPWSSYSQILRVAAPAAVAPPAGARDTGKEVETSLGFGLAVKSKV